MIDVWLKNILTAIENQSLHDHEGLCRINIALNHTSNMKSSLLFTVNYIA